MIPFDDPYGGYSAAWGGTDLHWSETVIVPPPCEPVSLTQVKHRLRVVQDADDADVLLLVAAARRQVESDTSAVLVSATLEQTVDTPPSGTSTLKLVRWPVQTIVSVTTYAADDTATVLDPASYRLDTSSRPARLILTSPTTWPSTRRFQAVTVRFTAGFAGPMVKVQDLTWADNIATAKLTQSPGFLAGDLVTFRGAVEEDYNNTFTVLSTTGNNLTALMPIPVSWPAPGSPATGNIYAVHLGTPEPLQLAVLALVTHWFDPLRAGLTTDTPTVLPFGYDVLTSDRLEWLV